MCSFTTRTRCSVDCEMLYTFYTRTRLCRHTGTHGHTGSLTLSDDRGDHWGRTGANSTDDSPRASCLLVRLEALFLKWARALLYTLNIIIHNPEGIIAMCPPLISGNLFPALPPPSLRHPYRRHFAVPPPPPLPPRLPAGRCSAAAAWAGGEFLMLVWTRPFRNHSDRVHCPPKR